MDEIRGTRRRGAGGIACGLVLALVGALGLGLSGAAAECGAERFQGDGAGRRDRAGEIARAAFEARRHWSFALPLAGPANWDTPPIPAHADRGDTSDVRSESD